MKRYLSTSIFLVVVMLTLILSSVSVSAQTTFLSMGTGESSGTYYYLGAGFAKIVEEYYPEIRINAQPTDASFENGRLLVSGDLDIGWACVGTASTLHEQEGLDISDLQMIGIGHRSDVHIMTLNKEYKTVKDFIGSGARIAVGPHGSATKVLFNHFLLVDGLGLVEGEDYIPVYYSFSEAERGLKEGTVDVAITAAGFPLPGVIDMASTNKVYFIDIPDDVLETMIKKRPYVKPLIIPKETYAGMEKDNQTFYMRQTIMCRKEIPEDVVYKICKAIFEHPEEKNAIHPQAALWNLENLDGLDDELPIHPGALKFYQEKGAW